MFIWPWILLFLLLLPILIWLYHRGLKPPAKAVVMYPQVDLLQRIHQGSWRKHLAAGIYLAAFSLAVVALARPTLPVPTVDPQAGIILAMDVSRSMRTQDISPNRFEAARSAIRTFVENLPAGARVGLVTFGGYATVAMPLTDNHDDLLRTVDTLSMIRGTAIGDGLLESLSALPDLETRQASGEDPLRLATIILLSDGRNRNGTDPLEALSQVKAQQVTVHTVGVGSQASNNLEGWSGFDESTLRKIADDTGGQYFFVDSAEKLEEAYTHLNAVVVKGWKRDEVAALGTLAAAILLCVSLIIRHLQRKVF
jgi:Ca-activated chloride channel homolog